MRKDNVSEDISEDIRMVAIDLDGTLLNSQGMISPKNQEAIRQAVANDVKVVIATGRMYSTTAKFAHLLDLDTPLICFNGAYITDRDNRHKRDHYLISMDYARDLHEEVIRRAMHANYYLEDDIHVAELNELVAGYQKRLDVPITVVEDMEGFFKDHDQVTKITIQSKDVSAIEDLEAWIHDRWPSQLYTVRSNPLFLEVSYPGITKGTGVASIADSYGLRASQVMAIGDAHNDLSMMEYAGLPVAMGNAPKDIKERVRYVTRDCDQDGVAHAIDRFILKKGRL